MFRINFLKFFKPTKWKIILTIILPFLMFLFFFSWSVTLSNGNIGPGADAISNFRRLSRDLVDHYLLIHLRIAIILIFLVVSYFFSCCITVNSNWILKIILFLIYAFLLLSIWSHFFIAIDYYNGRFAHSCKVNSDCIDTCDGVYNHKYIFTHFCLYMDLYEPHNTYCDSGICK
jgi:hypothetical protein